MRRVVVVVLASTVLWASCCTAFVRPLSLVHRGLGRCSGSSTENESEQGLLLDGLDLKALAAELLLADGGRQGLLDLQGLASPPTKPVAPVLKPKLASTYPSLSVTQLLDWERNGHTITRGLLEPDEVALVRPSLLHAFRQCELDAWVHSTRVMFGDEATVDDFGLPMFETIEDCQAAFEEHDVELPFLQTFNSWRFSEDVAAVVQSPRLAQLAAQLLNVPSVRLYQDSMFFKRPWDSATRWHSDLHMAPFDTNHMVTVWIPLTPVPAFKDGGTGLSFASGSHRDFALAFWSRPHETGQDFEDRYKHTITDGVALAAGDATWHHGWTLHSAPPNETDESRFALTASYIAADAHLLASDAAVTTNNEDTTSYESWVADLKPGAVADHPSLPVVWP